MCDDGMVLNLNCTDGYTIYTCDKVAWNYAHTLYQCQFPGFDIVLQSFKMSQLGGGEKQGKGSWDYMHYFLQLSVGL